MKPYVLIALIFLLGNETKAQQKPPITAKINTPTVQCEKCKARIERYLKYEDGIIKVIVDFKQKKTMVTFLDDRTNIENIKTAIANTGYDADDVTASPDAYEKLPKTCKKPLN